ncbi:hypothetical protein GQ53DRAFT_744044 [Thozetella sp. PMI_491]|nr:hypothetical protein GQ53DRAFT_744044 [Thozetella sp. PMI_491]
MHFKIICLLFALVAATSAPTTAASGAIRNDPGNSRSYSDCCDPNCVCFPKNPSDAVCGCMYA